MQNTSDKTLETILKNIKNCLEADKKNVKTPYWLAKESGVTQATISRLLNREIKPSFETIVQIADALKKTPAELMTEKLKPSIPADIVMKLQDQTPQLYDAVRGVLAAVKIEGKKKN